MGTREDWGRIGVSGSTEPLISSCSPCGSPSALSRLFLRWRQPLLASVPDVSGQPHTCGCRMQRDVGQRMDGSTWDCFHAGGPASLLVSQLLSGVFSFLTLPCLSSPSYALKKKMTCFFNLILIPVSMGKIYNYIFLIPS